MKNHQHINQTSGEFEYYTPPFVIEIARKTMGRIELDPASSEVANRGVMADRFFSWVDDGLAQEWKSPALFMNHPFGAAERACAESVTGRPCEKTVCAKRGFCRDTDYPGNAGWVNKLVASFVSGKVRQAVCITYASTSEAWFQPLLDFPQCFLAPRTNYLNADGTLAKGVSKGSVLTYLGPPGGSGKFRRACVGHGKIKVRLVDA